MKTKDKDNPAYILEHMKIYEFKEEKGVESYLVKESNLLLLNRRNVYFENY
jgi:hypothetical protein